MNKWLLGILGTVIAGVAVFYLTIPGTPGAAGTPAPAGTQITINNSPVQTNQQSIGASIETAPSTATPPATHPVAAPAPQATLRGKFIDENDFSPDGHVANVSISIYDTADNSLLTTGTSDQNGNFEISGPMRGKHTRVVAAPPAGARCRNGQHTASVTFNSESETTHFKDECKF